MSKNFNISVNDIEVNITKIDNEDFICLTDMVKARNDDTRAADVIKNWIRTRTTIEFLGTWEYIYNPNFKVVEFDHFKKEAGLPTFVMSVSNWVTKTNAKGIFSKSGKNGGTYAHKDIAFEFGSAISPVFKLYLIKEYQRLKEIESNSYNLEWNVKRVLSKVNYHLHTDAIKSYVIPTANKLEDKQWLIYAEEADILNMALFKCTAKEWRDANMERHLQGENIRDMASINELTILSNLESLNSVLIKEGIDKSARFDFLSRIADEQKTILNSKDFIKTLKKQTDLTFIEAKNEQEK